MSMRTEFGHSSRSGGPKDAVKHASGWGITPDAVGPNGISDEQDQTEQCTGRAEQRARSGVLTAVLTPIDVTGRFPASDQKRNVLDISLSTIFVRKASGKRRTAGSAALPAGGGLQELGDRPGSPKSRRGSRFNCK
jgi:hypothetical protein